MHKPLRIGIDCREHRDPALEHASGIARYVHELVSAFGRLDTRARDGATFVLFFTHEQAIPGAFEGVPFFSCVRLSRAATLPLFGPHVVAARAFAEANVDLLHGPANVVPLAYRKPFVTTVHDLLIYGHPEWFPGGQGISTKVVVPRSLRRASAIVAPSEAVANEAKQRFGNPAVTTIPHGRSKPPSDEDVDRAWDGLRHRVSDGPFVSFVGTIEPRKNLGRLVEAVVSLRSAGSDIGLVLAGKRGWGDALPTSLPEGVVELGSVTDAEKYALLRHSAAFAYPSLAEGFGLPIVEAMGEGTPVITSDEAPMSDVAGDAAFLCDPHDAASIGKAIKESLENKALITNRVQQGRRRAESFDWNEVAKQTMRAYVRAMK